MIGWGADSLGGTWGKVLQHLSTIEHNDNFAKGVIDTKDVLYYVNLTLLALFLAYPLGRSAAVEGMIRRLLDWGGYLGLAVLAGHGDPDVRVSGVDDAATAGGLLLARGIVLLLLASLLARVEDYRGLFGHRTHEIRREHGRRRSRSVLGRDRGRAGAVVPAQRAQGPHREQAVQPVAPDHPAAAAASRPM